MSEFSTFIKEGRHIFSICPECGSVHRLSELQLSRRGKYVADWMDKVERQRDTLEQRRGSLKERAAELQDIAKEKAERKVLPQLLQRAAPMFYKLGIDPRDVRTVSHPIDFVVFNGMNSRDGVQDVSLVNLGSVNAITSSIGKTIESRNLGWRTVRVRDDGTLESDT
jgi:predicted Holliday junction resolvase-like endonuclease